MNSQILEGYKYSELAKIAESRKQKADCGVADCGAYSSYNENVLELGIGKKIDIFIVLEYNA